MCGQEGTNTLPHKTDSIICAYEMTPFLIKMDSPVFIGCRGRFERVLWAFTVLMWNIAFLLWEFIADMWTVVVIWVLKGVFGPVCGKN